jgi:hypothetical protein
MYDLFENSPGRRKPAGVNEGIEVVREFAPPDSDDGDHDPEEILFRLAKQWWLGTESDMIRVERTLASMGWEIGEDEGSYDDGGVFVVRAGDVNGDSYESWPHEELVAEGVAEAKASTSAFRASNKKRAELNSMSDQERRAYDKEQQEKQRKRDDARLERERSKNKGVAEGEVTKTSTGIVHKATDKYGAEDVPFNHHYAKDARDLDAVNKQQVKDLDASMGITWKNRGTKGVEVDEAEQQKGADYRDPPEADYGDKYQDMVRRVAAQEKRKQQRQQPPKPQPKRENSNMPVAVDSTSPIHGTNEDNDSISTKNVGPTSQKLIRTARQAAPDSRSDLDAVFAYLDDVAKRTQDNYQEVNNILQQLDPLNTELQKTERELDDVENVNQAQQQLLARLKTRLDKVSTDKTPAPVQQKQKDADERDAISKQLDQEPKQVVIKQEPQGPVDTVDTYARREVEKLNARDLSRTAKDQISGKAAVDLMRKQGVDSATAFNPDKIAALAKNLPKDEISEDIYESRLYKMKLAGYFD